MKISLGNRTENVWEDIHLLFLYLSHRFKCYYFQVHVLLFKDI